MIPKLTNMYNKTSSGDILKCISSLILTSRKELFLIYEGHALVILTFETVEPCDFRVIPKKINIRNPNDS